MRSKKLSVSVVIPNYNGKSLLEKNLPHIIRFSEGAEIIIVDDASTDDSVAFVEENFPKVSVVKHSTNLRFAAACNSGVSRASGDVVILLNNDVVPESGYLQPLVEHFKENNKLFAVGCGEINSHGLETIESGKGCGGFVRGFFAHWPCSDLSAGHSLWASGGSGAFSRTIWEALGGMDRLFAPAYEEDRDICYRALKAGYEVYFEPKSIVKHIHETSNQISLGSRRIMQSSYKNQLLLFWKNCTSLKYWMLHIFWQPYHLVFTGLRSRGAYWVGLLWALSNIPQLLLRRMRARRFASRKPDEKIYSIT